MVQAADTGEVTLESWNSGRNKTDHKQCWLCTVSRIPITTHLTLWAPQSAAFTTLGIKGSDVTLHPRPCVWNELKCWMHTTQWYNGCSALHCPVYHVTPASKVELILFSFWDCENLIPSTSFHYLIYERSLNFHLYRCCLDQYLLGFIIYYQVDNNSSETRVFYCLFVHKLFYYPLFCQDNLFSHLLKSFFQESCLKPLNSYHFLKAEAMYNEMVAVAIILSLHNW